MTPQLFLDLADGYRALLEHYRKPRGPDWNCATLFHQSTPDEIALLKHIGHGFSGPARHLALNQPTGWDDVDIKYVIDAAYFLYRDPRLRIGEPRKYEDDGSRYGALCDWLAAASFDDTLDYLQSMVGGRVH